MKKIIFFIFLLILTTKPVWANNWGLAQDAGVKQGWLVPYNGEQQGYTGIPCAVRQPTQTEVQETIGILCGNEQESNFNQCKKNTVQWIDAYPTCESRNIGVRKASSGVLETFDIPPKLEASPTPQTEAQPVAPAKEKQTPISPRKEISFGWADVIAVITMFAFVAGGVYCFVQYKKVGGLEKEIDELEDEWDRVPKKSMNPYVNNDTLMKIIDKNRQPIERKIQRLKQKRQFILDKIPLVGWFKK